MKNNIWKSWDHDTAYGEVFYKRAIGELDEMESSKALCQLVSKIYQPGMTLADIGCGAGHYLRSLRQRVDENIAYTGIDATPYYIELAKKAFPDNAAFMEGSIFEIPVGDAKFDIVINNNVLLHLPPPPKKPLEELIRISKKHIIIRTLVGQSNYIIKDIHPDKTGKRTASQILESELVKAEDELSHFNYYNMYTAQYFEQTIRAIDPDIKIEILKDTMWEPFDDTSIATQTVTKTQGNTQIAGNLLMDWHFLILTKAPDA